MKTDGVARVAHRRGHCLPFWPIFPPLQVAPSFACSVASLNQSPGHQLPGYCSLHRRTLADYQLGWGRPSTWLTGHTGAPSSSNTLFPRGDRRVDTPSEEKRSRAYHADYDMSSCMGAAKQFAITTVATGLQNTLRVRSRRNKECWPRVLFLQHRIKRLCSSHPLEHRRIIVER